MPFVSIRHRVSNYEVWRAYFDADTERQRRAGATTRRVYRALDDHSDVVVLFQIESKEKFRPMLEDEDLRVLMAKAGVVSEPVVTYWEDCGGMDLRLAGRKSAPPPAKKTTEKKASRPKARGGAGKKAKRRAEKAVRKKAKREKKSRKGKAKKKR
ncbi:MAG: hypothetical protein U0166_04845 [Acidobacteriota bacterium]